MKLYKIAGTTYCFDGAIGALIKVGTKKDLGNHELITPNLPENAMIEGRPQVSRSELFHIGKRDANFTHDDIDRLHDIRNGYDSHEEFLKTPLRQKDLKDPNYEGYHILYSSPNMEMTRQHGGGPLMDVRPNTSDDEISISVGGELTRGSSTKKHTKELGNMVRAFDHFTSHPSGRRIFHAYPIGSDEAEVDSKRRIYKRLAGFEPVSDHPDDKNVLFVNHMAPPHKKERMNELYRRYVGSKKPTPPNNNANSSYRLTPTGQGVAPYMDVDYITRQGIPRHEAQRAVELLSGDEPTPSDQKILAGLEQRGFMERA